MAKPFTDKILWSAIIQSFSQSSSNNIKAAEIKPNTKMNYIFPKNSDAFYQSLEKIVEYLEREYQYNHVRLDIGRDELFETFEIAEDVFLYFHFKINHLEKLALKIMNEINKKNS